MIFLKKGKSSEKERIMITENKVQERKYILLMTFKYDRILVEVMLMLPDSGGIYKIVNKTNGKIYIGSAINLRTRWNRHKSELRRNIHCNMILQRSWNRYGEESFQYEIVELIDDKNYLENREQHWIDTYKSYERSVGYNILRKAYNSTGFKHDDESKRKISDANKRWYDSGAINPMKGIVMSNKSRLKMSKAKKGKYVGSNNPFYGKKHSDETRKRISETRINQEIKGENHHRRKLTESQVTQIKLLIRDTDLKPRHIAKIVGVQVHYVGDIKRGKTWSHISIDHIQPNT